MRFAPCGVAFRIRYPLPSPASRAPLPLAWGRVAGLPPGDPFAGVSPLVAVSVFGSFLLVGLEAQSPPAREDSAPHSRRSRLYGWLSMGTSPFGVPSRL